MSCGCVSSPKEQMKTQKGSMGCWGTESWGLGSGIALLTKARLSDAGREEAGFCSLAD